MPHCGGRRSSTSMVNQQGQGCGVDHQRPYLCQDLSLTWTEQPKVADLHEAFGQHVLQKAADELFGRQRADLRFLRITDSIAEGRSEERRVGKESRSRWSPYH